MASECSTRTCAFDNASSTELCTTSTVRRYHQLTDCESRGRSHPIYSQYSSKAVHQWRVQVRYINSTDLELWWSLAWSFVVVESKMFPQLARQRARLTSRDFFCAKYRNIGLIAPPIIASFYNVLPELSYCSVNQQRTFTMVLTQA